VGTTDDVDTNVTDVVDLIALDDVVRAVAENTIVGLVHDADLAEIPSQDIVSDRVVVGADGDAENLALFPVVRRVLYREALEGVMVSAKEDTARSGVGGRDYGVGRTVRRTNGEVVFVYGQVFGVVSRRYADCPPLGRDVDAILDLAGSCHVDGLSRSGDRIGHIGMQVHCRGIDRHRTRERARCLNPHAIAGFAARRDP